MKPGSLLKKRRLAKNLTLDELSKLTSLSVSYLSKLERSDGIPPFATLQTLARILDFNITEALNLEECVPETDGDSDIIIFRHHQHEHVVTDESGHSLIPLTTTYENKAISPFLMSILPGQTSDFTHDAEEFILVLEGRIKLLYKGVTHVMSKNDSAYLDSRYIHSFINETDKNALLLSANYMYRRF